MISTLAALPSEVLAALGMLALLSLYVGKAYAGDAIFSQPGVGEKKRMTVVNERLRALGALSLVLGASALVYVV
ncbi:hypothetical protein [Halorubrum tropicale]|uniref:Uncharacterized protein n=1 Tax=Halorubrum tropicale TaxID=1765655 RepID=A0A0N1IUR5_9EURY|nr:hypothetical protein [Halorubrum tropicale]KOX94226.1 hypothetical protein AMR74_16090 [Halorubrum tropicale]